MTLMRTCTKCFLQKPVEEFGWKKGNGTREGKYPWCGSNAQPAD
jgi:hypothetical protein